MEIAFDVPESSIGSVILGLQTTVKFSSLPNFVAGARISEVGKVAATANAFPVKAALIDSSDEVRSGMTAEVTILVETARQQAAYLVPVSALAPGEDRSDALIGFVFRFDDVSSTVKRVSVRVGGVRDNLIVIEEGVAAGDIIAVAGVNYLNDGQKVKLLRP